MKPSSHYHHLAVLHQPTELKRWINENHTALPTIFFIFFFFLSRNPFLNSMRVTDCFRHTGASSYPENWLTTKVPSSAWKKNSKRCGLDIQTADELQHPTPVTGMSLPLRLHSFKSGILQWQASAKGGFKDGGRLGTQPLLLPVEKGTERMLNLNRLR